MKKIITNIIYKTLEQWTILDPILQKGELAVDAETLKVKEGDGKTKWSSLDYLSKICVPCDPTPKDNVMTLTLSYSSEDGMALFSDGALDGRFSGSKEGELDEFILNYLAFNGTSFTIAVTNTSENLAGKSFFIDYGPDIKLIVEFAPLESNMYYTVGVASEELDIPSLNNKPMVFSAKPTISV